MWIFLVNTFEVNTRDSRVKMLRIANHHDARLDAAKADPDILALYTPFHAALLVFRTLMAQLVSGLGVSKGNTQQWEKTLDEMANNWINAWEGMVFNFYPRGTPEATAIFPNNKTPFQNARYDERMLAVEALHDTLLTYPSLTAAATDVNTRLTTLRSAREVQLEQFGKTDFSAIQIEAQRKILADLLDNDLCKLKVKYRPDMEMVQSFFDPSQLRKSVNDNDAVFQYSSAVEAGTTMAVILPTKLQMSANAACTFTNTSNLAELQFFFSASASAADNPVKTTVLPNESAEGTAAESGWAPGCLFLIVKNMGTVTAEFDMVVMEAVS